MTAVALSSQPSIIHHPSSISSIINLPHLPHLQAMSASCLGKGRGEERAGQTRRRWRECVYCQNLLSKNVTPASLLQVELAGFSQSATIERGVCDECFNFWDFASAEFRLPTHEYQTSHVPTSMQPSPVVQEQAAAKEVRDPANAQ